MNVSLAAKESNAARSLRIWPPDRVETLRFLVEAGLHSFSQIGDIMGISKNKAIGKANRLDLDGPRMQGSNDAKPTTLLSRLGALHAAFDATLAAKPPARIAPNPSAHRFEPEFRARGRA